MVYLLGEDLGAGVDESVEVVAQEGLGLGVPVCERDCAMLGQL